MAISTLDEGMFHSEQPTDRQQIAEINDLKIQLNDNRKKVLYGRYTVFALTALVAFSGYELYRQSGGRLEQAMVPGVVAAVYLLCALVSFRYPLGGVGAALAIYLLDHLSTLYLDPPQFAQGFGLKIAIVTGMGLGLYAAYERRRLLRDLAALPVRGEELDAARKLGALRRTRQPK